MDINNDIQFSEISTPYGEIGLVILTREKSLNALSYTMTRALDQQLDQWQKSSNILAVVIRSVSEKAFCAGGDIRQLYEGRNHPHQNLMNFFAEEYRLNHRIYHYPKPYIALINGIAMGGGLGISLHGSHRIGANNLTLAMPETAIGFYPDIGASYFLSRCPQPFGIYLGLTGARININDAQHLGLIDCSIPYLHFEEVLETLKKIDFRKETNQAIFEYLKLHIQPISTHSLAENKSMIEQHFSHSTVETIIQSLQRDPHPWAQTILEKMQQCSPTSLKVTLQQLQLAKNLDFDQCMKMEYRLTWHFVEQSDFFEGIRARLIDKDQNPKWQPATLDEVTDEIVNTYFSPIANELEF